MPYRSKDEYLSLECQNSTYLKRQNGKFLPYQVLIFILPRKECLGSTFLPHFTDKKIEVLNKKLPSFLSDEFFSSLGLQIIDHGVTCILLLVWPLTNNLITELCDF